jgi:hypothetical protein
MTVPSLHRTSIGLALCLLLALPASPQTGGGSIGPSKGEIIGIIAGVAAGLVVVGVLVYHGTHKHPSSITGCVAPGADGLTLRNEKDKKMYALSGYSAALNAGERVTIQGKKIRDASGKPSFQVATLAKDFAVCTPWWRMAS